MPTWIGSRQKQSPEEGIPEGGPIPLGSVADKNSPEEGIPEGGSITLHRDRGEIGVEVDFDTNEDRDQEFRGSSINV